MTTVEALAVVTMLGGGALLFGFACILVMQVIMGNRNPSVTPGYVRETPDRWHAPLPDWAADAVVTHVQLRFTLSDRFWIALGRSVEVSTKAYTQHVAGRTEGRSRVAVQRPQTPWAARMQQGGHAPVPIDEARSENADQLRRNLDEWKQRG